MSFVDEINVYVKAGNGGDGCVSFRREKFVENGGPDGGNGGNGGSVIFIGSKNVNSFLDLRYRRHVKAENGAKGSGKNKTGKTGQDAVVSVPLGTVIIDKVTKEVITEIIKHDDFYTVAKGGKGGLGNSNFKSSTRQAPDFAINGTLGPELEITLKLKMLSDIGIIGMPNVGKSTLFNRITNGKSKTANYSFTTLRPYIGILRINHDKEFVIADIPGLIEGAHHGAGLGNKFLKHIERCMAFLHILDAASDDIQKDYKCLVNELIEHNKNLINKKSIIIINRCDLIDSHDLQAKVKKLEALTHTKVYTSSILEDISKVINIILLEFSS